MKTSLAIIGIVMLLFFAGYLYTRPPALKCFCEKEKLEEMIKQMFDADEVSLRSIQLREELYFPEIRAITVDIVNATTNTLDFKSLPEKYQRFDNFSQVEDSLKKDAEKVAHLLFEKCDTENFNDIMINFIKYDSSGQLNYQFICHYREDLFPEKWEEYLKND